jgi:hypothetical protein
MVLLSALMALTWVFSREEVLAFVKAYQLV